MSKKIAAFYQCFKEKAAFKHSLDAFCSIYPESEVFIFNDGGDKSFIDLVGNEKIFYKYCERTGMRPDGLGFDSVAAAFEWISRFSEAVKKTSAEFILLLEDDVWVKKATNVESLHFDINGCNKEIKLDKIYRIDGEMYLGGFGGSIFRTSFFRSIFSDMNTITSTINFLFTIFKRIYSDQLISYLTYSFGGTVGQYDGLCETWWPDYEIRNKLDDIEVLHKYKEHYYKWKVCLVVNVVGEKYMDQYERIFKKSQENYARKCGYDYKIISEVIGKINNPQMICLSKQLICSQDWAKSYDFIIVVDADIYINIDSPPIHLSCLNTDKIGMVNEITQPTREMRALWQKACGYETTTHTYFLRSGYDFSEDILFNGGLLVLQPSKHAEFTKTIYDKYCDKQVDHPCGIHFEQATINYEYFKSDMIFELPHKWNAIWAVQKPFLKDCSLMDFVKFQYFTHFAGHFDYDSLEFFIKIGLL